MPAVLDTPGLGSEPSGAAKSWLVRYNASEPLTPCVRALATIAPAVVFAVLLLADVAATPAITLPALRSLSNGADSALAADATFEEWTWSGNPCQGTGSDFTAHFLGNASGGTPPYTFLWNFGDGSPNSTLQDPGHIYSSSPSTSYWVVTLSVTDSSEANNSTSILVPLAAINCPAEVEYVAPPTVYYFLGGLGAAGAIGVMVVLMRRRRPPATATSRPPQTPPSNP